MSLRKGIWLLFVASLLFSSQGHSGSIGLKLFRFVSLTLSQHMAKGSTCDSSGWPGSSNLLSRGCENRVSIVREFWGGSAGQDPELSCLRSWVSLKEPTGAVVVVVSFH